MGVQNQLPRPQRPRSGAWYSRASYEPEFVNGYASRITNPVNGYFTRDPRPNITVVGATSGVGTVDLQVEWRQTPNGSVAYTTTFIGAGSGTPQVLEPPADLALTNWYYRARAGKLADGVWGRWTATRYLTVYPLPGFASVYVDLNIGVENLDPAPSVTVYADLNVGLAPFDERDGFGYVDINVGLEEKPRLGAEYLEVNVVPVLGAYEPATYTDMNITTTTPTPHIWYVQPQIGPQGLMFKIIGQGFGAFQGEYDGKVLLGDLDCPIVSWTDVPESASEVIRITRTTGSATNGTFTLKPSTYTDNAIVFEAGDYVEFDYRRLSPAGYMADEIYWRPYFNLIRSTGTTSNPNLTDWNDQDGINWASRVDIPVDEVHHRTFLVPSALFGSTFHGANWGWTYTGSDLDITRPAHVVEIRNFVYRNAAGIPKLWIFGEDGSAINLSNMDTQLVTSGVSDAFDAFIDQGATNKAHQEILALVPDGAESGMVQIVLEG